MPPKKSYRKKRPAMKRRGRKPAARGRGIGAVNTANVVQTLETFDIDINQPYTLDVSGIIGDRALAHAEQYGLYRIAKVEFKYKPKFDTFIPQNQGATPAGNFITTVPQLYWKMNRYADAPVAFDADNLRDMGAVPHRLDDKTYTIAYKPNVLLGTISGGDNSGQLKMTPWLNTDQAPETGTFRASTTSHYGHFLYVEADLVNTSSQPVVCTMDVTIHYEFKTPRVDWTASKSGALAKNPLRIIDQEQVVSMDS